MKEFFQKAGELAAVYSTQALISLIILIIGFWVARRLARLVTQFLEKTHLDPTFITFSGNVVRVLLYGVVLLAALNTLGVQMTSVIALLGTIGLAVALALKDSLNNVASGISLLILRPFKVGDFVEIGSTNGAVKEINFFHTLMNTSDNRRVAVPNAKVLSDTIVNYSTNPERRIDMVFGIGYGSDLKQAKALFLQLIAEDERILKEPEPVVAVSELADSSVNFVVRPWVATDNYWPVRFDFIEKVKLTFDQAGIEIPFPQRDMHIYYENQPPAAAETPQAQND